MILQESAAAAAAQDIPSEIKEQANTSTDTENNESKGRRESDVTPDGTSTTVRRKTKTKLSRKRASANQAIVNQSTETEESVQITTRSIRNIVQTMSNDCRSSFKMENFWYALILGLLPTTWDVNTDISLGERLLREGRVYAAALCWMLVCFTPGVALCEYISKVTNSSLAGLLAEASIVGSLLSLAMWNPEATYYLAVFTMIGLLIVKSLAVFLHTPGMTELSAKLSQYECKGEATGQLLLRECVNRGKCPIKLKMFHLQI